MRAAFIFITLFFGLAACAGLQRLASPLSPRSIEPLSILFTANRYGAIETSHATLKPLGGVQREWNLAHKWLKSAMGESLFLASGTTFVPPPKDFDLRQKELYLHRATYLVEALNKMPLSALSPSLEDFGLGRQPLMDALKAAKFQLVSSNLYDTQSRRPLFNTYLHYRHEGVEIYVLGITAPPSSAYARDPSIFTLSPREAVATVLEIIPHDEDRLVILLSNVNEKERENLMREFPELHIVLGADRESTTTFNAKQWTGSTLYLNPQADGKALSLMELELKKPIVSFYNPSQASNTGDLRPLWQARLQSVFKELESLSPKSDQRETLLKRKKEYEDYYRRLLSIPTELTEAAIPFRSTTTELDDDHQLPENELTELLKRYRESIPKPRMSSVKKTVQEALPLNAGPSISPAIPKKK